MASPYESIRRQLPGGGELALEALDEDRRMELGRRTYDLCRSIMNRSPELRALIKTMAAQIREEEAALAGQ